MGALSAPDPEELRVFLIAGEPSGDVLGAGLIQALRRNTDAQLSVQGVGGPQMQQAGLVSLFPMADLAVMGLLEVLPRIPQLRRRIAETVAAVLETVPDIIVTIDSPGFTYRVVKQLRQSGVATPIIHYVAPTVWAWKPKRAAKTAALFDHLLTLFPFEPPYFEAEGLPTTYVGHPAISERGNGDAEAFRSRHAVGPAETVIAMLPGSRRGEVRRHLPVLEAVVRSMVGAETRKPVVAIPVPASVAGIVRDLVADWPVRVLVVETCERHDLFAASRAAIAKSGTVTLEVAIARLPFVTIYKANPLTVAIVRRMIRVPYVTLANILLKRPLVPELLQQDCTAPRILESLLPLLVDGPARDTLLDGLDEAVSVLTRDGADANERAAAVVLAEARKWQTNEPAR